MNLKNLGVLFFSALFLVLTSCKKEIVTENNESLNAEVTASNATADGILETSAPIHKPRVYTINSNVKGYYETLPALYSQTTKKYPLIIFIHGIGELGTTLSRLNCCGLPRHAYNKTLPPKFLNSVDGKYYSYIVISPQFVVRPSAAQVQSVINFAKSKYRVDASRIYVTGLSMGGGSTWDWSVVYGQNAAAITPVCAGTRPTTTLASYVATKNLPIWSLNSNDDQAVPIQWGKDWINWIDARNTAYAPKTKLTIWYGLTHNDTWWKAFDPKTKVDGQSIYEWMLRYTRGTSTSGTSATTTTTTTTTSTTNALPIARAGADQSVPKSWNYYPTLNGTTSSDSDGWIVSFKWTQLSGPTTGTIVSSTSGQTKLTNLIVGKYTYRLTVTDNKGAIDTDDVVVTITSN
jgi:poly(3-hydroxybutyrate) depolymerase